jgi:hypothetical protein
MRLGLLVSILANPHTRARCIVAISLLLACVPGHSLTNKATFFGDIFFDDHSAALPGYHQEIDRLACLARGINLEVVILVGHADRVEDSAQALSLRRANAARDKFVQLGLHPSRLHVEAKGYSLPTGSGAVNRRVEVEMVGTRKGSMESCEPGWDQTFLQLPVPGSLALAAALGRDGQMPSHVAAIAAIRAQKYEHFDAMLTGPNRLPINRDSVPAILRAAVLWGGPDYVGRLLAWGVRRQDVNAGMPLVWLGCGEPGRYARWSDETLEKVGAMLLAWGAEANYRHDEHGRSQTALHCAALLGALRFSRLLLQHGADPNISLGVPPLIQAGRHPHVAALLLTAGADPKAKSLDGETLFHRYLFSDPQEVRWLVGLGLDIEAKSKDGSTPLQSALYHAKADVLDAFLREGASLSGVARRGFPMQNVEAVIWLVDRGAVGSADVAKLCMQAISQVVERSLPVFEALARRNVDFSDRQVMPVAVTKHAIEALAPDLVSWLLVHGALSRGVETAAMREYALASSLVRRPPNFMYPSQKDIDAFNTPAHLAEREARRKRIVELLLAHESAAATR